MCGRGFRPRFLFTWPNARIATMSAESSRRRCSSISAAASSRAIRRPTTRSPRSSRVAPQYGEQSDPYYATARLWDDGLIEPARDPQRARPLPRSAHRAADRPPRPRSACFGCYRACRCSPRSAAADRQPRRDRGAHHAHLPRLGIETVAVYSDADARALHVRAADAAIRIGPPPARTAISMSTRSSRRRGSRRGRDPSRLRLPVRERRVREAVRRRRPDLRRPVGRTRSSAMGSKIERSAIAEAAGVPIVPGLSRRDQDDAALARRGRSRSAFRCWSRRAPAAAARACARVDAPSDLAAALDAARREADGRLRRRHAAARALRRSGRAISRSRSPATARQPRPPVRSRVLDPAPSPEAYRGGAGAASRPSACARSCCARRRRSAARSTTTRRHRRVPRRAGRRALLPRDEHPAPGRASVTELSPASISSSCSSGRRGRAAPAAGSDRAATATRSRRGLPPSAPMPTSGPISAHCCWSTNRRWFASTAASPPAARSDLITTHCWPR